MKFKKALVFACAIAIPFAANAAFKDVTVNGTKITAAEQEQILPLRPTVRSVRRSSNRQSATI